MKIVAVKHDGRGAIEHYKLDNGKVVDHEQAVGLVESGEIADCNVTTARNGRKSIRSKPDGDPSNNLDNLPSF